MLMQIIYVGIMGGYLLSAFLFIRATLHALAVVFLGHEKKWKLAPVYAFSIGLFMIMYLLNLLVLS